MAAITPPSNVSSVLSTLFTKPEASSTSTSSTAAPAQTTYQKEFANLKQLDAQELLYASFLSQDDSIANGNDILQQAAKLLGTPGHPGTLGTLTGTDDANATPAPTPTPVRTVRSVTEILAASDAAAQKTFAAYAKAPAGSSILDFQA